MSAQITRDNEEAADFTLSWGEELSAWLAVDVFVLHICKTDEGLVIDVYPDGDPMGQPLTTSYVYTEEALDQLRGESA